MTVWNLDDETSEGTLPLVPSLHHTVDMLLRVLQVQTSISSIATRACEEDISLDHLSRSNTQVAHSSNELAASVLAVIKSCVGGSSQILSHDVQVLSHEVARSGKNLNHLIKKHLKPVNGCSQSEEFAGRKEAKTICRPLVVTNGVSTGSQDRRATKTFLKEKEKSTRKIMSSPTNVQEDSNASSKKVGTSQATGQVQYVSPVHQSPTDRESDTEDDSTLI